MSELVRKLSVNVPFLGKTLKGKFNTEYVVIQGEQTYVVREHDKFKLKHMRELEVFEVDMTLHPIRLSGKPESSDSTLFFEVEIELGVHVIDSTIVVRVQQPMQMLAQKAASLVREVASKYEVDNYMQAKSAIHQALLHHPDFVITGLEVVSANIKIEPGKRERVHIGEKALLKLEYELQNLKAKQDAELEKMRHQHAADLAKTKANYDAHLLKEQLQRDLELRKEQMAYIEQLLRKGEAGLIGLKMLDPSFSMHDLMEQLLARRAESDIQELQLLQDLIMKYIGDTDLNQQSDGENFDNEEKNVQEVSFTGCFPTAVKSQQRYTLLAYMHLDSELALIQQDFLKFIPELGDRKPQLKSAKQKSKLKLDTAVTLIPECDDVTFYPDKMTKRWDGHWSRFIFDFVSDDLAAGETLFVRVSVQIEGIEIAHIKGAVEVVAPNTESLSKSLSNPLLDSKMKNVAAKMYNRIFISYSREDSEVIKAYRLAQIAVGNDVFLDTESIRSGEDWRNALARAIDQAEIFQLFWSEHSAISPNVKDEWNYALNNKCADDECRGFIRPVFWKNPLQPPPPELSHLNFRFVPLTGNE